MTVASALDILVARTGHVRYRELCDPVQPAYNPSYIGLVIRLASGLPDPQTPGPVPLSTSLNLLARMRSCPHRSPRTDCGCGGLATCALEKGKDGLVNYRDCQDCLSGSS